jgi:NADP-dependent 3-hydroxy acid dehydrogenase YdfG
MGNLKMNNKVLIITGSDGATAQGLINYFEDKYEHIIGFSRKKQVAYQHESVEIMKVDMLDSSTIISAIDSTLTKYQEINGWINCVGGFSMGSFIEDADDWESMHSINFITCLNGCRAILPQLKKQHHGCIINFGSKAALEGFPTAAPYLISKSAVHSLTKLISIEMNDSQARCNAILPGIIDTPANRTAMPNEDYSTWESIDDIGSKINDIFKDSITGQLITL